MPGIDDRVRKIVTEELKSTRIAWNSKRHQCSQGSIHTATKSFGGGTFTNAGLVFEICPAQPTCAYHCVPLVPEQYLRTRLQIWTRIAALEPSPNDDDILGGEAVIMRDQLREEVEADGYRVERHSTARLRATAILLSSPSSPAASSGSPSRSSSRSSIATSQRGPLGRPHNPVCEVIVYVYVQGRHNPLIIQAQGTPRDEVVEFCFRQRLVYDALNIEPADPAKAIFAIWHHNANTWTTYPKAHQVLFLARGERVLYRDIFVGQTPNLEHYKALLLPPKGLGEVHPLVPVTARPLVDAKLAYGFRRKPAGPSGTSHSDSSPVSPTLRALLDQLPFSMDDSDDDSVTKVRKRSASPVVRQERVKRARADGAPKDVVIDLTTQSDDVKPRVLHNQKASRGRSGRKRNTTGSSSTDVILLSD